MKRVLSIVMIITSIVILFFFQIFDGDITIYHFILGATEVALLWFGVKLFISTKSKTEKNIENSYKKEIERLKTYGNKVKVIFNDCEIVTKTDYKELTPGRNSIEKWDYLFDADRTVERAEITRTRVLFEYDEISYYSSSINKDKTSLSFYLYDKKETTLYIDKDDNEIYYFDLEFLLNKE